VPSERKKSRHCSRGRAGRVCQRGARAERAPSRIPAAATAVTAGGGRTEPLRRLSRRAGSQGSGSPRPVAGGGTLPWLGRGVATVARRSIRPGTDEMTASYVINPIGYVESRLIDPATAPKQGFEGAPDAWLVFNAEVAEGLRDLTVGADLLC
jgi:hypothetical protein